MSHRILRGLICFAVAAVTSLSAAGPHPTMLTVKYKDLMLPVVKLIGSDPVVLVDGKEKRIRTEPTYQPQRIPDYSPAEIALRNVSLGGVQIFVTVDGEQRTNGPVTGNQGGLAEFRASVTAKQAMPQGFIAVVLYSEAMFASEAALFQPQIVVHALPPLPAGVEVPVRVTSKMFTFTPGQKYFVQVFDQDGAEILTPFARQGWSYYASLEKLQLATVLKQYLIAQAGRNAPARPVVSVKPLLPPDATRPTTPITASFGVTAEGHVEDVRLSPAASAEIESAVRNAMGGWLFLPQIKAGTPVACRVEVPLRF